jgi:hypothetical protein
MSHFTPASTIGKQQRLRDPQLAAFETHELSAPSVKQPRPLILIEATGVGEFWPCYDYKE